MNLSYNPKTGHVMLDKAVIGRIEGTVYTPYRFAPTRLRADTLEELLKKIRESLTRSK